MVVLVIANYREWGNLVQFVVYFVIVTQKCNSEYNKKGYQKYGVFTL